MPAVSIPCWLDSVTYAVDIANSRSVLAGLAVRLRPRSASRKPMPAGYAVMVPWSCCSSWASAAMRFSIGGCVENSANDDCFVGGEM